MVGMVIKAEGLERIVEWLHHMEQIDFRPLAQRIKEIIVAGNEKARAAGIGVGGEPLEPIKPQTIKRRARAGKGMGPPLAPEGAASRVSILQGDIVELAPDHVVVYGTWPEAQPWLRFHSEGVPSHNLPVRLIIGITPEMYADIVSAANEFINGLMAPV